MRYGFWFLIFPGFLFSAGAGMLASWLERKMTARIQYRVGPPLLQPWWDLYKLMSKETIIPKPASRGLFIFAPLLGLLGATISASILGTSVFWLSQGFVGDLIVFIYFLLFPGLSVMLGGIASRNPIAGVGVAREMKLIFSYELALLIALAVVLIKTQGELSVSGIIFWQKENGALALFPSGALALLIALLGAQAKLSATPFDLAEAETELSNGVLIEYSGVLLGIYKLTRMMMLVIVPSFLVVIFLGGIGPEPISIMMGMGKYLALFFLFILLRNLNPRVRTDQALRFFWYGLGALGLISMGLAISGW